MIVNALENNALYTYLNRNNNNHRDLFYIADFSSLFKILYFIYFFKFIKITYNLNCYLGIPERFYYLKNFLDNSNDIYVIKNSYRLESLSRKFDYLFLFNNCDFILDYNSNIYDNCFESFYVYTSPLTIKSAHTNLYSDLVGVNLFGTQCMSNKDSLITKTTKNAVEKIGYELEIFKYAYNYNNIYNSTQKGKFETIVNDLSPEHYQFSSIVKQISQYRYFIGVETDVFLLALMILGADNCILLDDNKYLKSTFPFIINTIPSKCMTNPSEIYNLLISLSQL